MATVEKFPKIDPRMPIAVSENGEKSYRLYERWLPWFGKLENFFRYLSLRDSKLTFSEPFNVQGVPEHADNAAALAAGLIVGDEYRTGDFRKIVH